MVVTRQTTSPAPAVVTPIGAKDFPVDASAAARGAAAFGRCVACHGRRAVAAGMAPDLRASSVVLARSTFADVVRGGSRRAKGMPVFAEYTDEMLDDLRALPSATGGAWPRRYESRRRCRHSQTMRRSMMSRLRTARDAGGGVALAGRVAARRTKE